MMRSLFSGVAGLRAHQTKMDVIGNNIANVNTTAYKSSSVVFSDLMSQTTQKASGANAATGTGGVNARQIGLGVKTGAISMNVAGQGASQSTGNAFDMMISGSNFFVVSDGTDTFFTRDGSFYVDGAGNLAMSSTGYNVMGWGVDEATQTIKQDTVDALRVMSDANLTYPPEATSKAYVSGIIDKNDTNVTSANGKAMTLNFFDKLGYTYTAKMVFKQSDDPNSYSLEVDKIIDSDGKEVDISKLTFGNTGNSQPKKSKISLNEDAFAWDKASMTLKSANGTETLAGISEMFESGEWKDPAAEITVDGTTMTVQQSLDAIAKAHGFEGSTEEFLNLYVENVTTDAQGNQTSAKVSVKEMLKNLAKGETQNAFPMLPDANGDKSFTADGRFYNGVGIAFDSANGKFIGIGGNAQQKTASMELSAIGENFKDIEIDFSSITMFDNNGTSTVGATSGNIDGLDSGRSLGKMIGVSVQNNGMIFASYDNGMTKLLGQIASAAFSNVSGLEKAGDNLYKSTLNSGDFDGIGVDITASGGSISTGQLEMSNVDLSQEFTEMITTQRGFQANSRIITVSDTMIEELTNLKR
ncbi:MAG: flagellar hook-basal body complex protein [Lachnospiraceae bacterium]|nr:flagellar hook-basal body complex protein [Lachnospiraceae bacterium]